MTLTTSEDVKRLGTIMGIWAHPDDESFLAAGLLQAAVQNGQTIVCVTATKGEAGVQDPLRWPKDTLGKTRSRELIRALQILGVKEHHWLDFRDGGCAAVPQEQATQKLAAIIKQYSPDTFVTFGPDGLTGHPDHVAVSAWTQLAADQAAPGAAIYHAVIDVACWPHLQVADKSHNIFFNIKTPPVLPASACDICLKLSPEQMNNKCAALRAMESQTASLFEKFDDNFTKKAWNVESFVQAR
jgi:LmbE family N-acetylglucosaminyl deacetylase